MIDYFTFASHFHYHFHHPQMHVTLSSGEALSHRSYSSSADFADTIHEASIVVHRKMESQRRRPSPNEEAYLRLSKFIFAAFNSRCSIDRQDSVGRLPGHFRQEKTPEPAAPSTVPSKDPETPKIAHFLLDWHGLPSPQTPEINSKIDHMKDSPENNNQSNGVFSGNLDHVLEPSNIHVEKQSSLHNDNAVQIVESLQSDLRAEGSCPTSLEGLVDIFNNTENDNSPLGSMANTGCDATPLSSTVQSQDVQQLLTLNEELSPVDTIPDDEALVANQDLQVAEQDAELARALEAASSPIPLRRSSRISKTIKNKGN